MAEREILAPPAAVLLDYAIYGWAFSNGMLTATGKPRLPDRDKWLPVFAALLTMPGWRLTIGGYAREGMTAWGVDASIAACAVPALATDGMRERLARLLADKGWSRPIPAPAIAARAATPELALEQDNVPAVPATTEPTPRLLRSRRTARLRVRTP
jgi:hypothetical protein